MVDLNVSPRSYQELNVNIDLNLIPLSVRKAAWQIIADQAVVPVSPLTDGPDGKLELCAAAALAIAAVDGHAKRQRLVERFREGGSDSLVVVFEEFGWTGRLGAQVLALNDAIDPKRRKSEVLQLLQS